MTSFSGSVLQLVGINTFICQSNCSRNKINPQIGGFSIISIPSAKLTPLQSRTKEEVFDVEMRRAGRWRPDKWLQERTTTDIQNLNEGKNMEEEE